MNNRVPVNDDENTKKKSKYKEKKKTQDEEKKSLQETLFAWSEETDRFFYMAGWIFIALACLLLLAVKVYGTGILEKVPKCIFHEATGFYCPGCGGSRAFFALVRGKIDQSIYYNPVVPYIGLLGFIFMFTQTMQRIRGADVQRGIHFRTIYAVIAVLLVIGNFIVKNAVLLITGKALLG